MRNKMLQAMKKTTAKKTAVKKTATKKTTVYVLTVERIYCEGERETSIRAVYKSLQNANRALRRLAAKHAKEEDAIADSRMYFGYVIDADTDEHIYELNIWPTDAYL